MAERFRIPWTTGKMEISHSDCATIPPAELVEEWADMLSCLSDHEVFSMAAHWGADQELEACVKLLELSDKNARDFLYSARRPKPLSAKEQALFALAVLTSADETCSIAEIQQHWHTIRRALEQLDD